MSELSLTSEQQIKEPATNLAPLKSVAGAGAGFDFAGSLQSLTEQPAIKRSLPLIGLLLVLAASVFLWLVLREPPQRDLFRGLPEHDKAAVAAVLDQVSIGYAFDDSTGALTVSEDDYHSAKMSLASNGLPKSAPDGDSLISSMPMGASRAVENEKLRSARELDLARTIEAIDSVLSARVHLAVEAPSIFIRDRSEPSASVMLKLASGQKLSDSQVQSIVHLVASSVTGLTVDQVSLIDQNGRLMSNSGSGSGSDLAEQHLTAQTRVEERYRATLMSLLTPMLGADNFTAEVTAELNFDEKQATRESFPQDDARIKTEQGSWSNEKGEPRAFGIPGALSNRPPEAATVSDTFDADNGQVKEENEKGRTSEKYVRQFELGREVSVTKEAAGSLRRLSVAVALRSPVGKKQRSKEELAAVEALVKGAIGFNTERGDVVAIEARNFQPVDEIVENWWEAGWVSLLARNLSALLVALALIFGIGRPLLKKFKRSKNASPGDPKQLASEIGNQLGREGGAGFRSANPVSLDMISSANGYSERAVLIQDFVRQNPDHAAMVVKELLLEVTEDQESADA